MRCRIALFKGGWHPLSVAIRWQTDSQYSHAALLFGDFYLIEAWASPGVRTRALKPGEDVDIFEVAGCDDEASSVIWEFAQAQVGKGYDWLGVLRFISRNRLPENDRWFCSELVFEAFKKAEINLLERTESWRVSPGMLSLSPLLKKT